MLWADMRLGLRLLSRRPWHTAIAILTLCLGIGLTTAMYSILYGTFLRGLPFDDPHRFVIVDRSNPAADMPRAPVTYRDFLEWRSAQQSFEDLVAWFGDSSGLTGEGVPPERVNGAHVTANLFGVIGVRPSLGRGFLPEDSDPAAPPVAIVSHRIWKEMFGSDPTIVGRPIQVSGEARTLVGVMPPGFGFPLSQDVWMPMRIAPGSQLAAAPMLQVFGKLKEGVPLRQAQAEMSSLAARLERERPETNAGFGALLTPFTVGYTDEGVRQSQTLLMLAACAVLLIACANVAGLLQVQAVQRLRELAVRTALGAGRRRLAGQLLAESSLLVLAGGLLGLIVARWAVDGYRHLFGELVSTSWMEIKLHPVAFLFALGAMALAVLLAGLPAALLSSRVRPAEALKQSSAGGSLHGRIRKGLAVAQIALSFALLVVTGLMVKSILNLGRVELGAAPDEVLVGQLSLDAPQYREASAQVRFLQELERRVAALPGVRAAGLGTGIPGEEGATGDFQIEGRDYPSEHAYPVTRWAIVSASYFDVLGLTPVEGRSFLHSDDMDSMSVAVVNRSFARRYFPGESPVGRRIRFGKNDPTRKWITLVGVVPDVATGGFQGKEHDALYMPMPQKGGLWISLFVRTEQDPLALAPAVRRAAAAVDPSMTIFWADSLAGLMASWTLMYRSAATLFTLFGALALFLAAIGLYGVLSFAVRQRTRDLGVRMALGARGSQVRMLVLRDGALQIALGIALGAALAAAGLRLVAGFVFGVSLWDPAVFLAALLIVAGTSLLACLIPSARASRISPLLAIRETAG